MIGIHQSFVLPGGFLESINIIRTGGREGWILQKTRSKNIDCVITALIVGGEL